MVNESTDRAHVTIKSVTVRAYKLTLEAEKQAK